MAGEASSSEGGLRKIVSSLARALNKNQGYLADAKKKLTFDGANITEFLIDYENLAALLKWTEEEKMDHRGQHVSLSLARDIMAILAASRSWKETPDVMMRKYLAAEKMATEADLAAVQRKNFATYNDFLREFTLVALRIPGVTDRIMSKYFLRQFSEFDKDKILSAYQQTSKFVNTRDVDFNTVTDLTEKMVVTETLALLKEGEVIDLTSRTGDKVKKGIESLHERVHGVDNKIERMESALLVMQAQVSRPPLPPQEAVVPPGVANCGYGRRDPANEQCKYCTVVGHFVRTCQKLNHDILKSRCTRSLKGEIFGPQGERGNWNSPGGMRRAIIMLNGLEITVIEAEPVGEIIWDQLRGREPQVNFILENDGRDRVNATTRLGTARKRINRDTVMEEVAGSSEPQAELEAEEPEKIYGKPREEEPTNKVTAAKKKFRYQIPILSLPEIDDTSSKLLGTMVSVSFQTMLQASPRLLKGLRQLLTRRRVEIGDNPEVPEGEREEEAPQEVANLQRSRGDLEDLEKAFADIRLSLLDREGGEVMRSPPETKLSFHALPVGKLKIHIGTHHTDALVDGGAEITLIRRDFATITGSDDRNGRKCLCRKPSPLHEGEGIKISCDSEGGTEKAEVEEGGNAEMGDKVQVSNEEGANMGKRRETWHGESEGGQDMRDEHEEGEERRESPLEGRSGHDSCEGYWTGTEIPFTYDPKNLAGGYNPIQIEDEEDEEEDVQEVIKISSGDERDEISRPREEGRPPMHQLGNGAFRWENEFGPTPSHSFQQWTNVIRHEWIIKTRELAKAGVEATPLDFFSESELQEIAFRKPLYGDRFLEVSYIYSGGRGRIEILIGASGDITLAEELYLRSVADEEMARCMAYICKIDPTPLDISYVVPESIATRVLNDEAPDMDSQTATLTHEGWMRTQRVLSDALKRWIEVIEQYDFEPQYIKGEYNKVVDALSHRPDFSSALITEFGLADDVTHSMVEAYREDWFMSEIIRRLEAKDKATSAEFELVNELLFPEKTGNKHLCVPDRESLRSLFLGECHNATGHFGFKKTAANLLQRFWWPTMMRDAKLYVETCQVCQRDKPRTQAPLGLLKPLPIPERPAAEQGTQLQMTSGNHPEANGQTEQLKHTVQHLLRHYIKRNQVDWDEKLALIASLYNNAVHSATGVSPNSLLLTFKPRLPLDFQLPENQSAASPGTLEFAYRYEQLMQQAVEQMHKAQVVMIESENKHHRPSTFQVGKRVWVKSPELEQEYGISRKLMPQYFGPWEILDVVGNEPDGPSYVIRIPGHLRTYPVFHASKLAPSRETDQFPSRRSMLPPTMDGEVDIDDIVDHREMPVPRPPGRGRPPKPTLQYRVRFRHHTDPKEDGWFTREELMQTAPQVVAHYGKSLQKGKRQIIED
ncbi:hypothetical protein CBR_g17640 [Chara braunii]|uniref:Integrase catalytic domain-containing protein n=1 Tax=Chara braunii TaxID=69332 RepID=A0A388KV31_CHABU|nr:hypothetical protein CBR_g17640 [Chara braunii]|eukprot:GBG73925.1 hypothetical protein CBR_g17640 [Chara braunii]